MLAEVCTLERVNNPSPSLFYEKYVKKAQPVVITGVADKWLAIEKWNAEFFYTKYGHQSIVVEHSRADPVPTDPILYLNNRYYEREQLGNVIQKILQKGKASGLYITYADIFQTCPELLSDVDLIHKKLGFPNWCPEKIGDLLSLRPGFWLGPAGTISPAHFDRQENLNVQIKGHKKWLLFSPEQSKNLYFTKSHTGSVIFSPVDVSNPDVQQFPLFKDANPLEIILSPGEIIYVPSGWWHYVLALDEAITLNFWWWSLRAYKTAIRVNFYFILQQLRGTLKGKGKRQVPVSMPTKD